MIAAQKAWDRGQRFRTNAKIWHCDWTVIALTLHAINTRYNSTGGRPVSVPNAPAANCILGE